jgi:predicted HicB family RNase H-like nuclease
MALKAGKPTTLKTQKELAIAAVQDQEMETETAEKTKMQRFNVDIPEALHSAIKIQAIKEGVKLNTLAIKIFEAYLKQ